MWRGHNEFLWIACSVALLTLGFGCQVPKLIGPSDQVLAVMTPEEIDAGVKQMLKEYPRQELSFQEKQREIEKMREVVQHGKIELVGTFHNRAYEAKGEARIVKKDDRYFLALSEDFEVDAGPFLEVHTSPIPDARSQKEVEIVEAKNVGPLKMLTGGQVYELPADTDISKIKAVVIYCKPYKLVFGFARFF